MSLNKKSNSTEVYLQQILQLLWDKKLKIILVAAVFVALAIIYYTSQTKYFLATTKITPISVYEEYKYNSYNEYSNYFTNSISGNYLKESKVDNPQDSNSNLGSSLNNNLMNLFTQNNSFQNNPSLNGNVQSTQLFDKRFFINLYIEKLKEFDLFEKGIKKFEIIKKENYENNYLYDQAVKDLAYKIKIIRLNKNEKIIQKVNSDNLTENWIIQSKITNKKKWRDLLNFVEKEANKEIQLFLIKFHEEIISSKNELKKFNIGKIDEKIKIELKNYENQTISKLLYLSEQAKIARTLNIAKNNLNETEQTYNFNVDTADGSIANIMTVIPYYLKGYEMIEKEIELIKSRKNKKAFSTEIIYLQKIKNRINSDKDLTRLNELFYETPITSDSFYAGKNLIETTKFTSSNTPLIKFIIVAGIIGILTGIINTLFTNVVLRPK